MAAYQEAISNYQRIDDTAAEGIAQYNLGHAYKDSPDIRDLDEAGPAYQRSLGLRDPNDALEPHQSTGTVHYEHLNDAHSRD